MSNWLADFGRGTANHFVADVTGDFRGDAVIYRSDMGIWQVARAQPPDGFR